MHTIKDRWIQTELVFTLAKNATKPNPFEIVSLQTTRKENNWKTEETLARTVVTLETERIKESNPWCLWWWRWWWYKNRSVYVIWGRSRCLFWDIFFLFRWGYSPLWALACRTIPLHLSLSITNSLHLLTSRTWKFLSTSSLHPFLGLLLRLVSSSSWVKIFLGILSSSILSRWPNQIILCPFIHFTIFSPLFGSSSSWFVLIFHSPSSYLGPYILLRYIQN